MSIYMTETEQWEEIKAWWKRHQRWISTVVLVLLVGVSVYRYWNWHSEKITRQASDAYERLMVASSNQEAKSIEAYAKSLVREYPKTVYADAALLVLAKHWVSQAKWDDAKKCLEQVAAHAHMSELQHVARIRLARILIEEKAFKQALAYLDKIDSSVYKPLVNELKGDVYAATGRYQDAEDVYREARDEAKVRGIGNLFLDMKVNELAALVQSQRLGKAATKAA